MPNQWFSVARGQLINPGTLGPGSNTALDLASDTLTVALVNAGWTFSDVGTTSIADITSGGGVIVASGNLTNVVANSPSVGVIDADDITFPAVSGPQIVRIVLYKNTGTPANDTVIANWDTGVTGLPIDPNGGDITLVWSASGVIGVV